MTLVMDTNAYAALMKGEPGVAEILENADCILVPVVVVGELFAGFLQGNRWAENWQLFQRFLVQSGVNLHSPGLDDSIRYGQIVKELRRAGTPLPLNDIWIAAAAMVSNAAVLSRDSHFERIPGVLVHGF